MRKCNVGIIGLGTVGSGIYKILSSEICSHPILKEIEIVKIAVKDLKKKRGFEIEDKLLTDDLNKLINDPSIDVIVEVMGGLEIAKDVIMKSLKAGKSVVTANKAVMARYSSQIYAAAAKEQVYVFDSELEIIKVNEHKAMLLMNYSDLEKFSEMLVQPDLKQLAINNNCKDTFYNLELVG